MQQNDKQDATRDEVARLVRESNIHTVSQTLGMSREQVAKLAGGLPVRPGTLALAGERLAALQPPDEARALAEQRVAELATRNLAKVTAALIKHGEARVSLAMNVNAAYLRDYRDGKTLLGPVFTQIWRNISALDALDAELSRVGAGAERAGK
jgi:hypothetical protein